MKKCLLTILAGALLIVSCQNYDDQFDDLNSQITALASQVAGLSKVQSDLTALQGTVSILTRPRPPHPRQSFPSRAIDIPTRFDQ